MPTTTRRQKALDSQTPMKGNVLSNADGSVDKKEVSTTVKQDAEEDVKETGKENYTMENVFLFAPNLIGKENFSFILVDVQNCRLICIQDIHESS